VGSRRDAKCQVLWPVLTIHPKQLEILVGNENFQKFSETLEHIKQLELNFFCLEWNNQKILQTANY